METYFRRYKPSLVHTIHELLAKETLSFHDVNPWGPDALDKLENFVDKGKLIRGCLVLLSAELFGKRPTKTTLQVASAIELLHSGLLIHDDIMDNDTMRRGSKSIHMQYEHHAQTYSIAKPKEVGVNLGMCLGDLGFFLAMNIVSNLPNQQKILQKISHEISFVTIAQMQDVASFQGKQLREQDIRNTYLYKTARYSFSLPLAIGAMLTKQSAGTIKRLEHLGESIGLVFQIQDDMLGLFGNPTKTGKHVGTDIRENKQTLYRSILFQRVSANEKQKLTTIFGNAYCSDADITFVQEQTTAYGITDEMKTRCAIYKQAAEKDVHKLPISERKKTVLRALLHFVLTRKQ